MRQSQRSRFRVILIMVIFAVISLLTNIISPLIAQFIESFTLSKTMAGFLPFAFFVAYAVMSIPTGMVIEKWGEKPILIGAFGLALAGSITFSVHPLYQTALGSFFVIGLGMAALQVAINPLLRVSGGEENYAFNSTLVQFYFGLAAAVSPKIYEHFVNVKSVVALDPLSRALVNLSPKALPWVAIYWIFTFVSLVMVVLIASVPIPRVERKDDEKTGAIDTHLQLLRMPLVWAYFVGIFCYVSIEQGLADWIPQFLSDFHHFDTSKSGADAVFMFWILMTVGAGIGVVLLKFFDSRRILCISGLVALTILSVGLFSPSANVSWYALAAMGFAISCMWSIVFSLALNSLAEHHGTFAGILCTGIVGGAIGPLLVGKLGDLVGLRVGLCFIYLPICYVTAIGLWARPLVTNKTIGSGE